MNIETARKALRHKTIIQHKDDPDRWGFITRLSDDGSTAYINKNGTHLTRYAITLDKIKLAEYW